MSTPVEIRPNPGFPDPDRRTVSGAASKLRSSLRLARFIGQLAIKRHLAPRLHVRPLVAELFLTDNCNLRCISCSCWRDHTWNELTREEWYGILDQLWTLGFVKLNFTGGEALIRRDAADVIAHARDLGFRDLHLNTNGLLLDRRRLAEVIRAGIRSFNISVDGSSAERHDGIRGRSGSFESATEALRLVVEQRERYGLDVRLNFTVLANNAGDLPEIAALARDLGVALYLNLGTDQTFLFRHEQVTGLLDVDEAQLRRSLTELESMVRQDPNGLPSLAALRYIPGHFGLAETRYVPCAESQLKLMVRSTGAVGGCWGHDATMNVRNQSIRSIIDSSHYRDEHQRFFEKDCVSCGSNYALNIRVADLTELPTRGTRRDR